MNYGFVIRNDRCIGCHACSTACKSENEVALGVHRTWVKNVETGTFPSVRRHFQVTRCNHCANPPCVKICPTSAMYQRKDGIVEFDPSRCIGCKACLQACPYDAIHIDPESGTAAKCHFCAHRVELDLEPACVVVCPEHAIISGDMDDPDSEISQMLSQFQVTVRKPEQGTRPKLFYVDGEGVSLHPTATESRPSTFSWSDALPREDVGKSVRDRGAVEPGERSAGPIHVERGRMAGKMVRTFYNVQHAIPWHWPVPAYLVTKGMGGGLFFLLALGSLSGFFPFDPKTYLVGGFLSLFFMGLTTILLVADLERPERFLTVLTRPQWGSWLVRGAFILVTFSLVVSGWWLVELAAYFDMISPRVAIVSRHLAFLLGIPLSLGAIVYTAFLFGQAEGRDLWQSTLLPAHLVAQALVAGSAVLLATGVFLDLPGDFIRISSWVLVGGLALDLFVLLPGELGMPHTTDSASEAAEAMVRGRYRHHFWWGGVVLGHVIPMVLVLVGAAMQGGMPSTGGALAGLAGIAALIGLYFYEYAYVMAPQHVPNS